MSKRGCLFSTNGASEELKSGQEEAIKKALTAPAAPAGPAAPATPASPGDKAAALKAMLVT